MTEPTSSIRPDLPAASYAVTGVTGHLGRLAVDALLRRGVPPGNVFALARDTSRTEEVAALGVGVREADFDRPDTLRTALDGIERLLFVSGSEVGRRVDQHTAVIDAAKAADVGFVVYTSVLNADESELLLAPEHVATEDHLQASGLPFAVARNGFYHEVYTARIDEFLARGEIVGAAGDGRLSTATRADYAEAAVSLLTGDVVDQQGYWELGGAPYTLAELAATITEVTGTTVTYRDLPAEEYLAALTGAGMEEARAQFVASLDRSIARGDLETDSEALPNLLGRAPTSIADAVRVARL